MGGEKGRAMRYGDGSEWRWCLAIVARLLRNASAVEPLGEVDTPQETLLNTRGISFEGFGSASTSTKQAEMALGTAQFPH